MNRLGLVGRFAVASAAAMLTIGLLLARVEADQIRTRALANAQDSASVLAEVALQSHLVPSDLTHGLSPATLRELDEAFRAGLASGRIARVKIWSPSGRVVYSDDHQLIGRTFPLSADLREALDGTASSDISTLSKAENVAERRFGQLFEVYLPLRFTQRGAPAGAFELYVPYRPIAQAIASDTRRLYLIIVGGLVLLWAALFRMVLGAARRMRRDAEELRTQAEENEYLALHDQLTDLPNRVLFRDRLEQALRSADRSGSTLAVLLLDLNRFKEVNDTLGHDHGDTLLKQVGPRIRGVLRRADTVARLGGDEFGVLLEGLGRREEATVVAEKIATALEAPFEVDGVHLEVSASIGIATHPEHASDPDGLLRRADVAMYVAKAARIASSVYADDHDHYTTERLTLVADLRRALDEGEITLHYQPKTDVRTGEVVGAEALARWEHPERGMIPPDQFIPLAEQTGLIRKLTSTVLRVALTQSRRWRDGGIEMTVALNLSARDLLDHRLPGEVDVLLGELDLSPAMLHLEITESTIMDEPARALDTLEALSAMGIRLSVDDFGTGYSSLAYLQRLPVHELKIDRSFVKNLGSNESDTAIVRSTIDLAHNLGLSVVAEGIEGPEGMRLLAEMGCDVAQGYFIARPMPPRQFEEWLAAYGSRVLQLRS